NPNRHEHRKQGLTPAKPFLSAYEANEGQWHLDFPTIEGVGELSMNMVTGVNIVADGVDFSGFHVRKYRFGVKISNSIGSRVGDCILSEFGAPHGPGSPGHYVGTGASISNSKNSVVENCFVIDSEAEGIQITNGRHMTVRNCRVYSRSYHENWRLPSGQLNTALSGWDQRGIDYGIIVTGGWTAYDNLIEDCCVEFKYPGSLPLEDTVYDGHGYGISPAVGTAMYGNKIRDCEVFAGADGVVIRGQDTYDNTIETLEAELTSYAVKLTRGAHDNTFKRLQCRRICSALATDDGQGSPDIHHNTFVNCGFGFHGASYDTIIHSPTGSNYSIRDNLFCNCTFIGSGTANSRVAAVKWSSVSIIDNTFVNSIVHDFPNLRGGSTAGVFGIDFVKCNFRNSSFWTDSTQNPSGSYTSCNDDDPGLVNTSSTNNADFHVDPYCGPNPNCGAPIYQYLGAVDRGTTSTELQQYVDLSIIVDIDGESGAYQNLYDIGCDEYYP
ncbi:hypothetical protein ACFL2H_13030, partial [Planctomycetota bacterium]